MREQCSRPERSGKIVTHAARPLEPVSLSRPTERAALRRLLAPTAGTGVLMAAYLLLRPYGDAEGDLHMARAIASPLWIVTHVSGALALACFAGLAVRLADLVGTPTARAARFTGLVGIVLVLPYYGAEMFGLAAVGHRVLAGDAGALDLVEQIRTDPSAMTMFGLGLLLLAVTGCLTSLAWSRASTVLGTSRWAAAPLGVLMALVLPQFFLPAAGRMAFGLATLAAAAVLVAAVLRAPAPLQPGSGE